MTVESPADVFVGRDYGRREYTLTPAAVTAYRGAVSHDNSLYTDGTSASPPVAPATLLHSAVYDYRQHPKAQPAWYLPNIYGNLHARQEFEFFRAVTVGDTVVTRSFIAERYAKRGRDYVVNEMLYFDADGRVVARGRTHQSFLRETVNSGIVVDKDREKSSVRRFDVDVSAAREVIPTLTKQITPEMCFLFSGPERNYHNDVDAAKRLGFPDIVVQGMMSVCFISEMMTDRFGLGWIAGGKLDVNLVNIVWGRDRLTCRGFVQDVTPEGERERAQLDVWAEKDDGTKVTVGRASALLA